MAFALMQTFLIPALPKLQEGLGTSGTWVTWTVTACAASGRPRFTPDATTVYAYVPGVDGAVSDRITGTCRNPPTSGPTN